MRRRKLWIALVVALGMGLAAGYLVMRQSAKTSPITKKEKTVKVVLVDRKLNRGVRLTKQDLKLRDWPERLASPHYVRDMKEAVGRVIITNVLKGEPLLRERLADPDSAEGLSTLIPDGRRAFTVRVTEVTGVAGFLLPGSRVDVLVTIEVDLPTKKGARKTTVTKTILQDVEVLAAGGEKEVEQKKNRLTVNVVTLLLSPAQGDKLALAATKGSIWLSLRNPRDKKQARLRVVSVNDLLGGPSVQTAPKSRNLPKLPSVKNGSAYVVEIFNGGKRTTVEF